MNKMQSVESKATQEFCAQCGSRLSSTESTETFCVSCLLHTALDDKDVDHAAKPYRFDQYELITNDDGAPVELGRGAMGVTYKALDTNLRCEVALKVIHPRYLADDSSRSRFLSEARAAAQLRHRNIASVFHLGSERGQYFYAMELVEGETIEDWVRHKGPIDCETALDITLQITRALIAAGDRKFVHRDVKPSNVILCTEADGVLVAKLIDFGLVRAITDQSTQPNASPVPTGFVGTPHYASPEQFAGKTTDTRSDIYSLGATLWFMLTGKVPFDGTREEIRQKQLSGALPLDQLKGIPRSVADLSKHMLAADPAKRPQTPVALKEQLNKCIATIDAARQKQRRRFAYGALAAAAIILGGLAASYFLQRKLALGPESENAPKKSIAVLPFANRIREPDGAYLVDGLRAQIVARMAKIANLKVLSGSATQRYQSAPENPAQVGAELGVTDVMQGRVEKEGDKFKVALRLIDARNNSEIWAQSYERPFSRIAELESDVTRQAARAVGVKLTEPEKRAIDKPATTNPQAYEAYLKGRYVWLQRNLDGFEQAKEYFKQAIALDPSYAKAYAGLADAYQFLGAFDLRNSKENYEKAKNACQRALELEPTLAEAHASAGLVAMNYDWDWPRAEQELRYAIALDPNQALFYDWYAEYLMAVGRTDEALANMERSRDLDPSSVLINSDLGKLLLFARRYDQAEAQLKATLLMDPDFAQAHWYLVVTYIMQHRLDEAIAESNASEKAPTGTSYNGPSLKAYAYAIAGRKREAEQMLEKMKQSFVPGEDFVFMLAYIGLGDKERALTCLERGYENHYTTMISLKSGPFYDPLRSDPRFNDLLRRVNLAPGSAPIDIVPEKSIAVLPFENLSDDKENVFFAEGIQEELLTRLAKIADLKVISRTSTQRFQSEPQNLRQIAAQLGVAYILEGSAQRVSDQVRVNVQLINAANDTHLWAETYDRHLTDIFAVESEIATMVANTLRAKLTGPERRALTKSSIANPEAYELYLKGRFFWNKRTASDFKTAITYFQHAIDKSPDFALAYAGLADTYIWLPLYGATAPRDAFPQAKLAAEKALLLDNTLAEAHASLAMVLLAYEFDHRGALAAFKRAIELNPNYATAHQWLGVQLYSGVSQFDESIAEAKRALELDPLSLIINAELGRAYLYPRRFDESIDQLHKTLELDPNFYTAHWDLGEALEFKGLTNAAISEYEIAHRLNDNPHLLGRLGHAYALQGRRDDALRMLTQLNDESTRRYVPAYSFAIVYLGLGNKEEAIHWLKKGFDDRDGNLGIIKVDPTLDSLHGDARFEELVRKVFASK